jgi:hypothetical protein
MDDYEERLGREIDALTAFRQSVQENSPRQHETFGKDNPCPKCRSTSGNDWSQCGGKCPMPNTRHYDFATEMAYAEWAIDPECLALCVALNKIPGIRTTGSCSGHGEAPFRVWLSAQSIQSLYAITRCIDRRYGGPTTDKAFLGWSCQATDTDSPENPVVFVLTNETVWGLGAYEEAAQIAQLIEEFVANKRFMTMFGYPI